MRRNNSLYAAVLAATSLVLATGGAASADDISNNLDASVDAAAESMSLNVGGPTGTTQLRVVTTNGDGKNGCNLTGSTTLTLALASSNAAAATVTPSTVTFTSCSDTATLTVRPVGPGTATVSAVETSNTTGATFNLAPATFSVSIVPAAAPVNTAPTVAVTGPEDGETYEIGSVPTAGCAVTDAEDVGEAAEPEVGGVTGPLADYRLGSQIASCTYSDRGTPSLSGNDSVTYTIADTGAPVLEDLGPTALADGDNGWYVTPVTNRFKATDTGAGFDTPNPRQLEKAWSVSSGNAEGPAVTIASGSVVDVAGNSAHSINSAAFKIDLRDPTAEFSSTIGSVYFGSVPAEPTCSASDDGSGPADCVVTGYSVAVGSHTLTATATDNAGRTGSVSEQYTVLAWTLEGFFAPVDMGANVWNTVKGGSTVPLKFEAFAGTRELVSVSNVKGFTTKAVTCPGATAVTDEIEFVTTGGTGLRYDTTGGQFIQNWATPKKPGTCHTVTVTMNDLSKVSANFILK